MTFHEAKQYIAGGVNSPVRAFNGVGGEPVFIHHAKGATLHTEDEKRLTDYCLSWGSLLLGHAHPAVVSAVQHAVEKGTSYGVPTRAETELAKLICEAIPSVDLVRFTNSGTEAVMGAVRVARGFTGKNKVIKFEGCYHGTADYLLVKAGSGSATFGVPNSAGVPDDFTKQTIVLPFNNEEAVRDFALQHKDDLAAIILEPIAGNMGVIPASEPFLNALKELSEQTGALLIFDEVMTGFRSNYGGVQALLGVEPDLTCLGKIIGGGLPIGAFGGKREIMERLSPVGDVYQAGTMSGNPVAVSAGIASLNILKNKDYSEITRQAKRIVDAVLNEAAEKQIPLQAGIFGGMFSFFFTDTPVHDFAGANGQDIPQFQKFFHHCLDNGIFLSPSCYEANFISFAHTDSDIEKTIKTMKEGIAL